MVVILTIIEYKELLYQVASNYLTETPPLKLPIESLLQFIKDNLWEVYECYPAEEVLEYIEKDTKSMISFLEDKGIKLLL